MVLHRRNVTPEGAPSFCIEGGRFGYAATICPDLSIHCLIQRYCVFFWKRINMKADILRRSSEGIGFPRFYDAVFRTIVAEVLWKTFRDYLWRFLVEASKVPFDPCKHRLMQRTAVSPITIAMKFQAHHVQTECEHPDVLEICPFACRDDLVIYFAAELELDNTPSGAIPTELVEEL